MNQSATDIRRPLISVIVPSFNQGSFISATIRSVIGQDFPDWELIIQDACSTDNTEQVCKGFADADPRIRFHREKDRGFADGVNRGLKKASGSICAIQSSDDYYAAPDIFSEVVKLFRSYPECVLVAGDFRMVDEHHRELEKSPAGHDKSGTVEAADVFTLKEHFPQGSVFFSTERARMVGGLQPQVDMVADTDFWIRLTNVHPVVPGNVRRVDQIWSYAIMHTDQRSADALRFAAGRAAMYYRLLVNEELTVSPETRVHSLRAALADAFHVHLQKNRPVFELRELHRRAFGREVPWSWRLKAEILKIPVLHRLYFRNSPIAETADFLAGGRLETRNWFESTSIRSDRDSLSDSTTINLTSR